MTAEHDHSGLSDEQRRALDEELVDALVRTQMGENADQTAARVNQVLDSLSAPPRRLWQRRLLPYGVAATLLIAVTVGVLVLGGPQKKAFAGIETILDRMAAVDQVYAIEVEPVSVERPPRHRRGPRARRHARPRPWELYDGARLSVRGEQYALVLDAPRRGRLARGFDGTATWQVGFSANSPMGRGESNSMDEILDHVQVDLYELLRGVQANWDLSEPQSVDDPQLGVTLLYYAATPRSPSDGDPELIEFWANPDDGQIHQMICSDFKLRRRRLRFDMCISLIETEPLPPDWFTRAAHE